ncbi:MAG: nucleotidyl transferase AbiEii/AbiGii toxin family protein [Candidatus Cloacimonadales bacterium]
MIHKIDSRQLAIPNCHKILEHIKNVTEQEQCDFMLIGAFARDLNLQIVFKYKENPRATRDIDFAIAISNWEKFDLIVQDLVGLGFEKDKNQKYHRLYYEMIPIDLVPFGEIENNGKIKWPPDFSTTMTVMGFTEVFNASFVFELNNRIRFNVVSLPGLLILKLIAWSERAEQTQKDGEDINFIMRNYSTINPDSLFVEHPDLIKQKKFDYVIAGTQILAREVKKILSDSPVLKQMIIDIVISESAKIETSKLANANTFGNSIIDNFDNLVAFKDEIVLKQKINQ